MASFWVGDSEFELSGTTLDAGDGAFVVRSSPRSYAVDFLPSHPGTAEAVLDAVGRHRHAALVGDRRVLDLHLQGGLDGTPCLALDATEALKSLDGAAQVLDFLVEAGAGKDTMVVAVGGGIIQDVVGFAAGVLKRGVPWTYVPTTLLSQADSCIGSKTGINFRRTKNLLGIFYAPRQVLVHPGFVATLQHHDLLSGLGEIYKLCITGGLECLATFERHLDEALAGDAEVLRGLAALSLAVKRPVIEADERDTDLRRALNFGHSIGHALESVTDYAVPHGIAVTIGALVESELSRQRGRLPDEDFDRLLTTGRALLPPELAGLVAAADLGALLDALGRDKKVEGRTLKLAVPVEIGRIEFLDFPLDGTSLVILERSIRSVLDQL